jgi:hypothetical protein
MTRKQKALLALANARAMLRQVEGPNEVEYLIGGLEEELRDGLARLEQADQANDHVAFYRKAFEHEIRELRLELASPNPDIYKIACCAMQAAWLARIWPVLQSKRLQWRAPQRFRDVNDEKRSIRDRKKQRCLDIAKTLAKPTPGLVRRKYATTYPLETPPSETSIRRYLDLP